MQPYLPESASADQRFAEPAYGFVEHALQYTAQQLHGDIPPDDPAARHIDGADLCMGLRECAWANWGLLAGAVLRTWGVRSTLDIGRIVFELVDRGRLRKRDEDTLDDFDLVFDFSTLETEYRIQLNG